VESLAGVTRVVQQFLYMNPIAGSTTSPGEWGFRESAGELTHLPGSATEWAAGRLRVP